MTEGHLSATLRALQGRTAGEVRSPADLERNAAFWLAVRAGTKPAWSSLRCAFDLASVEMRRVGEAPYLGALGFLLDAHAIAVPSGSSIDHALGRVVARAPHTLERTGHADHPIVLAGLVLLASRIAGQAHLDVLRSAVDGSARRGPAEALILAAATGVVLSPVAPDGTRALDLACLVLGRRALGDHIAGIFAWNRSIDPEHELTQLASIRPPDELDEFEALLAVAALESMIGRGSAAANPPPLLDRQAPVRRTEASRDAGTARQRALIITAIPIEFAAVRALLNDVREEQDPQGTVYEIGSAGAWEVYLAEFGAGNVGAAVRTERALQFLGDGLRIAMFVGVAGGVKDVKLGDVVVATKVHAYEVGKDTVGGLQPRPDSDRSSYRLLERARAEARKPDWARSIADEAAPRVLLGPIAAGEKVVANNRSATAKLLRTSYSDVLAVEMEGSGFLRAAYAHRDVEVLVVRGVSDLLSGKASSDRAGSQERAARHAALFAMQVLRAFPLSVDTAVVSPEPLPLLRERTLRALRAIADQRGIVLATVGEIHDAAAGEHISDTHQALIQLEDEGCIKLFVDGFGGDASVEVTLL